MNRHNPGICSKITGKRDLEFIEILTKPVCELTLHIQSLRKNEWFIQKILFCNTFFVCQWIIWLHADNPMITFHDSDIIQTFGIDWFHK